MMKHVVGIRFKKGVMELNETHFTVKRVNLFEELTEAGLLTGQQEEEIHKCQESQKNGPAS